MERVLANMLTQLVSPEDLNNIHLQRKRVHLSGNEII